MNLLSLALDLAAITVLAGGVYFQRYRRREVMVALIGLNVAVMAVSTALASASVGLGLGLGLFGVLSIIRLRSSELSHSEVAYYFVSLAMGLLCGLSFDPTWLGEALAVALVGVMYAADHPLVFGGYRHQHMTLDGVYTDERVLTSELEILLGAEVKHATITKADLVRGTTTVDVRYRLDPSRELRPASRRVRTRGTQTDPLPST